MTLAFQQRFYTFLESQEKVGPKSDCLPPQVNIALKWLCRVGAEPGPHRPQTSILKMRLSSIIKLQNDSKPFVLEVVSLIKEVQAFGLTFNPFELCASQEGTTNFYMIFFEIAQISD